jgi:hypothetical protein
VSYLNLRNGERKNKMKNEPKGELARYAYGFSDKKPSRLFWIIHIAMVIYILWYGIAHAAICHHYSRWHYPWPQHCGRGGTGIRMALKMPQPSAMRVQAPPSAPEDKSWYVEITKVPPDPDRDAAINKLKEIMK